MPGRKARAPSSRPSSVWDLCTQEQTRPCLCPPGVQRGDWPGTQWRPCPFWPWNQPQLRARSACHPASRGPAAPREKKGSQPGQTAGLRCQDSQVASQDSSSLLHPFLSVPQHPPSWPEPHSHGAHPLLQLLLSPWLPEEGHHPGASGSEWRSKDKHRPEPPSWSLREIVYKLVRFGRGWRGRMDRPPGGRGTRRMDRRGSWLSVGHREGHLLVVTIMAEPCPAPGPHVWVLGTPPAPPRLPHQGTAHLRESGLGGRIFHLLSALLS